MLERLLGLFFGKATVANRAIQSATDTFGEILSRKGFSQPERPLPEVRLIIIQEALRRAADKEVDGCARMDEFYDQLDLAADNIIAAFNCDSKADHRIRSILVFHKVL